MDGKPVRRQEGVLSRVGIASTRLDTLLAAPPPVSREGPQLSQLLEGLLVELPLRPGGTRRRVGMVVPTNPMSREEGAVLALLEDTAMIIATGDTELVVVVVVLALGVLFLTRLLGLILLAGILGLRAGASLCLLRLDGAGLLVLALLNLPASASGPGVKQQGPGHEGGGVGVFRVGGRGLGGGHLGDDVGPLVPLGHPRLVADENGEISVSPWLYLN